MYCPTSFFCFNILKGWTSETTFCFFVFVVVESGGNTPQQASLAMIPRFSNPHSLLQSTKVINRSELEIEYGGDSKDYLKENSKAIEQLHQLLDNSLPTWDLSNIKNNKRRKIEENGQVEEAPVRMCSFLIQFNSV